MREFQLVVDGQVMQVRCAGSGEPLLLINGLGAHTAMWGPLERRLADHVRLIEFDAPGTGRSDTPKLPVSVPRLARIAAAVLDAVDAPRADVLGYSMGGIIAQQLAADLPDRVRRVVLVATSPGLGGALGSAKAMLSVLTPMRYISAKVYNATIGDLAGGRARRDHEWVARQGTLRLRHRPSMRGYAGQMLSLSLWSGLPLLPRITAPVLVIMGDDDPLTPIVNGMLLANQLHEARLVILRGEGHLMLLDEDSGVHDAVSAYLAAPDLDEADVWQRARVVGDDDLAIALSGISGQLPPWGTAAGLIRRRHLVLEH